MTPADLLALYQRLHLPLIYWERVGTDPKGWKGPRHAAWNSPETLYPIDRYDPARMNLGMLTGVEIAPGKFLADLDFDWAPGLDLARKLIPSTGFAFGRTGKKISHAIFTTPARFDLIKYCDFDATGKGEGQTFIELRSGDRTHQTMIAPSQHSHDISIELVLNGAILHVETTRLQLAALDYAIGCLLLAHVPGGLHHDGRQAMAGFLLRSGLSPERVTLILEAVCAAQASHGVPDMSSKDVTDAALVVRTSLKRIEAGKKIIGGPKFAEWLGGDHGKWVISRLNQWLGHEDDFMRDDNGRILPKHQGNISRAITLLDRVLSYNEFSDKLLIDNKPLEDPQWIPLLLEIEREYQFSVPLEYFKMVIKDIAWRNSFHPVKQYLDALAWDQVPRLDTWLVTSAKTKDTPYVRAISAIMMIAAVRRIRQPGAKYDELVIWESKQGSNKSSAAQALCPDPSWFSDDLRLNLHAQQLIEATLGKWIIEASELSGKRKTEIESLKAMLSRQVDGPARMAYAHFPVERPRHFIIIGTTNSPIYLNDSTGARRFWPMKVQQFDLAWIAHHRDQLWAEACHREASGESVRLPEALWPAAGIEQDKRREIDPWEDGIRNALLALDVDGDEKRRISTNALWVALSLPIEKRDRYGALRIAEIMHRLGFKRTTVRDAGSVQTGYVTDTSAELAIVEEGREPGDDDVLVPELTLVKGPGDEEKPF